MHFRSPFFKCWLFILWSLLNIVFWSIDWLIDWQVVLPCWWWQLPEHWPASAAPSEVQPHRKLVLGETQFKSPSGNTEQEQRRGGYLQFRGGGGGLWFYCNVVRFFWCFILMAYILFIWLFSFLTHCKTFLLNDNALTFPWKYQGTRSLKFIRIIQNIKARFWYFWLPVWMKFDKNCHCQRLP